MATNVTPTLALFIFIVIILVSAFLSLYHYSSFPNFDQSKLHTFVAILAGLGVFVTFMFYYSVVSLQQQQQKLFVIQETSKMSHTLSNTILAEYNTSSALIPNFVFSLMPLNKCVNLPDKDPKTPEACAQKMGLSRKIFSVWQDLILANMFIDYEPEAYITSFLQNANSKQLYKQWINQKINFNSNTQKFGDLLFEYGLPIKEQTSEIYVTSAKNLLADIRYKKILL